MKKKSLISTTGLYKLFVRLNIIDNTLVDRNLWMVFCARTHTTLRSVHLHTQRLCMEFGDKAKLYQPRIARNKSVQSAFGIGQCSVAITIRQWEDGRQCARLLN